MVVIGVYIGWMTPEISDQYYDFMSKKLNLRVKMGAILLPDATFKFLQCHAADTRCGRPLQCLQSVDRWHPIKFGYKLHIKRTVFHTQNWSSKKRNIVYSKRGDSQEPFKSENGCDKDEYSVVEGDQDELEVTRKALSEARSRQEAAEKERDLLLEDLARSTAEQQEHVATIMHDKDLAITELEEAKSSFNQKLEEALEEKSNLESKLSLAKKNFLELAVQVEKAAEMALQQATSPVVEDAQLSAAEKSVAETETAYHVEEKIRRGIEDTLSSIVERSKAAIEKALAVAERTSEYETQVGTVFCEGGDVVDQISFIQSESIKLQYSLIDLESQLLLKKSEVDRIKLELEQAQQLANASDLRAKEAEKALLKFQEINKERSLQQEEGLKVLLEKMKKDIEDKTESASKAFKVELDSIKASTEVAKEAAQSKDDAYVKRCEALLRSLQAAEASSKMWRQRAETAESLLQQENPLMKGGDNDAVYVVNGGRIDLLTDDDSQRWKLLSDGPRREIPEWMARRIRTICPKFPPKRTELSKALTSRFKTLELPKHDEVWSIVQEKPSQGDTLVEQEVEKEIVEKEVIEKKRKALERILQRKTIQREKTPEEIKLEPGTGSGREIVFQGFNWESWRRQWYLELATKASDLSRCGITTVWLPPPTKSVAPQGYMPSDLYDLNSVYGSLEELKHCIEEMHAHDILTLGDVVLNHRCAHKQSPNGVWNIFGGKLAWGPEAIVCDDPNFQGRGNPSSGDIFHAAPNIDHSQEFVRNDIKQWLNWLRNEIGFDGWRLDFVRGFSGGYVKEYIQSSNPAYAVGEYWDSLAYEGGNMCYNQDAHRQRIINWINATGGTSSAFDVTTKGILHSALHNQYWRLIDPSGKPTGVMGWWPSRAVTFLENHDTGSTQGHWPFPRDKLNQGYAYILTHPGTPVVFYDHFYDFGIREVIAELIEARRRAGIHCRSAVKIYHANNDGYVAQTGDTLVVKLGHIDWNPSKENQLDGSWQKFVDKGADYQIWLRQ